MCFRSICRTSALLSANGGVEVDPSKVRAILEMPPPKNLKELRGLIVRLKFIRWFISHPIDANLSKSSSNPRRSRIHMNTGRRLTEKAFDSLHQMLLNANILSPPVRGKGHFYYTSPPRRMRLEPSLHKTMMMVRRKRLLPQKVLRRL